MALEGRIIAQGNIYELILELKTESCSKSKEEDLLKEMQKPDRKAGHTRYIPLTVGSCNFKSLDL